jgi:hypothetical protein
MTKNSELSKKLTSYSVLASVILLGAESGEAQIIYHKVTSNDTIPKGAGRGDTTFNFGKDFGSFYLDLNNDSTADFKFSAIIASLYRFYTFGKRIYSKGFSGHLHAYNSNVFDQVAASYGSEHQSVLACNVFSEGKTIGNNLKWYRGGTLFTNFAQSTSTPRSGGRKITYFVGGKWANQKDKFEGLRIKSILGYNYGWVRFSLILTPWTSHLNKAYIVVKDYAYQTTPNMPILAGDTGFFKHPPTIQLLAGDSNVCENDSVMLKVNNFPEGASLQLYRNDTAFGSLITDSIFEIKQAGNYYGVVSLDSNSTLTNSITIHVLPLPEKPMIHQSGDSIISTEANSYQWYLNSNPITDSISRSIIPSQSGFYQVMITDSTGCTNISDSLEITNTGIQNENDLSNLFVSNKILHVQLVNPNLVGGTLNVFDEQGKSVWQQLITSENFAIILTELNSGIYIVRLDKKNKEITKRISIQ